MVRFGRTWPLLALLVGGVIHGTAPPAGATFTLRISDGTAAGTVIVTDTDGDGALSYSGGIGNFEVVVSVGFSKPLIGDPYLADMDVTGSVANARGTSAGTLTIDITDTDFHVVPGNNGTAQMYSSMGGNISTGGTVTFQSWVDPNNREFGGLDTTGGTVVTAGPSPTLTGNFSDELGGVISLPGGGPFSMTSRTVITLTSGGTFASTDGHTYVATPAPANALLLGLGLPLVGGCWFLRRRPPVRPA